MKDWRWLLHRKCTLLELGDLARRMDLGLGLLAGRVRTAVISCQGTNTVSK
jgi:hypothetical protein